MTYLALKWLHIIAASLYIGISVSNGFIKSRADKLAKPEQSTQAMELIGAQNRFFLLPASFVLLLTGFGIAEALSLPLFEGWLNHALAWFLALSILLGVAHRIESHLLALAHDAQLAGTDLPQAYWRISRYWLVLGMVATMAIGVTVWVMVTKAPAFTGSS